MAKASRRTRSVLRAIASASCVALLGACSAAPEGGEDPSSAEHGASADGYCGRVKGLADSGSVETLHCGVTRGPKTEKKIALVFTAGYFCEGGPTFLDALAEHRAKASFFLLSPAAKSQDASAKCNVVVPRLVSEGHYVGPHSDTHPDVVDRQGGRTTITRDKFDLELRKNIEVLRTKGVTGAMNYWMPPSETYNEEIATWSAERGLHTVHMTECARTRGDYLSASAQNGLFSNDAIVGRVFECGAKDANGLNGSILFFHLGVGTSRAERDKFHNAFPAMLKRLVDDGYSFVRIDEMLDSVLPAVGTRSGL